MPSKSLHLTSKVLHVFSKPVHVTKYAMLAFSNLDIVISFCDTDTMITTNYSAAIIDTDNRMLKQWRVNNSVNKPSHQTSDIFTKLVYCRPHLFFNLPSPASHLLHVLSTFCTQSLDTTVKLLPPSSIQKSLLSLVCLQSRTRTSRVVKATFISCRSESSNI